MRSYGRTTAILSTAMAAMGRRWAWAASYRQVAVDGCGVFGLRAGSATPPCCCHLRSQPLLLLLLLCSTGTQLVQHERPV
ncbi:hypothetical protein V8C86DRAFT_2481616 [Haematococcus lacustris]